MDQLFLPMDLEELIPPGHVVRVVNEAVNRISDDVFLKYYPGGGRSSFHPKMLTKVLVYAYTQKITPPVKSLRRFVRTFPSCGSQHDRLRISNHQSIPLRKNERPHRRHIRGVLQLLIEEGYVTMEHYFLDGTKIEANANRYTFVWKKSTDKYQDKLQTQIRQLLAEIDEVNQQEQRSTESGTWRNSGRASHHGGTARGDRIPAGTAFGRRQEE